jgi:hypothetical protein
MAAAGSSLGGETKAPAESDAVLASTRNLWDLGADWEALRRAAVGLRAVTDAATKQADALIGAARQLACWRGDTAQSYERHRGKLVRDLRGVGTQYTQLARLLEAAAADIASAQARLDASWARLTALAQVSRDPNTGEVRISGTDQQQQQVAKEIAVAYEIRQYLDRALWETVRGLQKVEQPLNEIEKNWEFVADGQVEPFTLPAEPKGTVVIRDGNTAIVSTGPGDDTIRLYYDSASGQQVVTVNGKDYPFSDSTNVVIRAGAGNDVITVDPSVKVAVTVLGGDGNDVIRLGNNDARTLPGSGMDRVLAGSGADKVFGGSGPARISLGPGHDFALGGPGNDIIRGDPGDDTIYGGSGDDRLYGGKGRDYLEGGPGNDILDGGAGDDVLSGGPGHNILRGGAGNDALYGGRGTNSILGGSNIPQGAGLGQDVAYVQPEDTTDGVEKRVTIQINGSPGSAIKVVGSPEFVAKVYQDLDMMAGSPIGQQFLNNIDRYHDNTKGILSDAPGAEWLSKVPRIGEPFYQGDTVTIKEVGLEGTIKEGLEGRSFLDTGRSPPVTLLGYLLHGYHWAYDITYQTDGQVSDLAHEFSHVDALATGTRAEGTYQGADERPGVGNNERQAMGLPWIDPKTGQVMVKELSENALRTEMGMRPLIKYEKYPWPDR